MSISNRTTLDMELASLNDNILKLGSLTEEAIEQAMTALANQSLAQAQRVIVGDEQINLLRYKLEQDCLRLLATQFLVASDLRRVIAVIHIATELERIGDHASGIARLVERIGSETAVGELHHLPKMATRAQRMIRTSLQAYVSQDMEMARDVINRDEKIDQQYRKFLSVMLKEMAAAKKGVKVNIPTYLLWIGHNLERMGDRVTNIAERIIFMVSGEFVELDSE